MESNRELFIKAFMEAAALDNLNLKSEDEIEWNFSEKFIKSMDMLIRKNNCIKDSALENRKCG